MATKVKFRPSPRHSQNTSSRSVPFCLGFRGASPALFLGPGSAFRLYLFSAPKGLWRGKELPPVALAPLAALIRADKKGCRCTSLRIRIPAIRSFEFALRNARRARQFPLDKCDLHAQPPNNPEKNGYSHTHKNPKNPARLQ